MGDSNGLVKMLRKDTSQLSVCDKWISFGSIDSAIKAKIRGHVLYLIEFQENNTKLGYSENLTNRLYRHKNQIKKRGLLSHRVYVRIIPNIIREDDEIFIHNCFCECLGKKYNLMLPDDYLYDYETYPIGIEPMTALVEIGLNEVIYRAKEQLCVI